MILKEKEMTLKVVVSHFLVISHDSAALPVSTLLTLQTDGTVYYYISLGF
jgi:hypothetical protein